MPVYYRVGHYLRTREQVIDEAVRITFPPTTVRYLDGQGLLYAGEVRRVGQRFTELLNTPRL